MKKILVPVDFSGHTDITCNYALEIASVFGSEIRLFHTYFDQVVIADTSFPDAIDMSTMYNEELLKEIFHQSEKYIQDLKDKLEQKIKSGKIEGVTISTALAGGETEQELKEITRDFQPDIIIMGTKGKGNNISVWGSVSSFIINHAKVPVLTIPGIPKFLGFKNIMMAADLKETNPLMIGILLDIFASFSSTLHCVHFLTNGRHQEEQEKMNDLKGKFTSEEKSGKIFFEMVEAAKDKQKSIDTYIRNNGISLIAFHPYKRSFFYNLFTKNITKKNLFATNIPLLAIPLNP